MLFFPASRFSFAAAPRIPVGTASAPDGIARATAAAVRSLPRAASDEPATSGLLDVALRRVVRTDTLRQRRGPHGRARSGLRL